MQGPEMQGTLICRNPYPREFDRGIIEAMANQFKPAGSVVRVQQDSTQACRTKKGESCTYLISW
jgi:hypothetical protein